MHHIMAKFWWILGIRGLLGVLLGIVSFAWILSLGGYYPDVFGMSVFTKWASVVVTLILILGFYAFLDGLFAVILGSQNYGEGRRWWALIVEGILSIGMGTMVWFKPGIVAMAVLYWIAAWAILTGLLEIFQGLDLNEYKDRRKPFLFAGFSSLLFGVLVLVFQVTGIALVGLMGIYAFTFGVSLMVMAGRLRKFAKAH